MAASIPYLIGVSCSLYYIDQAPDIFSAQIHSLRGRISGPGTILHHILNDFPLRYLRYRYWGHSRYDLAKVAFLAFPIVGTLGLLTDRNLRSQPLGKRLLLLACVAYLGVAAIDTLKFAMYLIYSVPAFIACGALWIYGRWQKRGLGRLLASWLAGTLNPESVVLLGTGSTSAVTASVSRRRGYLKSSCLPVDS